MSTLPAPCAPVVIPSVVGATQLDVRIEAGVESWRCPACGAFNASPEVLLHEKDCPVEARIVAALFRFESILEVRG
jgi:hypothetical protein